MQLRTVNDYKSIAQMYHTAVSNYDRSAIKKMVREDYIQHNPKVPTGRAAFVDFLDVLERHQTKIQNIRMLNDGAYVIMHHVWKNADPFGHKETVAFHIIRIDDEDLIAEHWNVMTPMIPSLVEGETGIRDLDKTEENKAKIAELFVSRERNQSIKRHHRVFGEGNFVLSISEGAQGDEPMAFYELFRLENGEIKESWNVSQQIPTENLANNNTMFNF